MLKCVVRLPWALPHQTCRRSQTQAQACAAIRDVVTLLVQLSCRREIGRQCARPGYAGGAGRPNNASGAKPMPLTSTNACSVPTLPLFHLAGMYTFQVAASVLKVLIRSISMPLSPSLPRR